jgi:carbon-monoxide dehydrogenase small subunit
MAGLYPIRVTVNGQQIQRSIPARMHLVDFLREELGLKGSHLGCEHGVCGACSIELNGRLVRGCLTLAVQANGGRVQTIEGVSKTGVIADLQEAFISHNALQCGFCTSGVLMAAKELIEQHPQASRHEVREWISGNFCRCTGYHAIVDAICDVLERRKASPSTQGASL